MNNISESDRVAVVREYDRLAETYDTRWSFYVETTARETLARVPVHASDTILDVGCGTGALLSKLAVMAPAARLSGIDASAEMLSIAHRILPQVDLRQGWAEELSYADEHFDTVVSCNMFHFIRDPSAALREMFRVLKPGGTLVITDWCDDYLSCRLFDWYLRCFDRAHFRMYGARSCRELLHSAGSGSISIERYRITLLWGLMTAVTSRPGTCPSVSSPPVESTVPDAA